ncbi:VanZ family protein [Microbacterium oxydans]|uniref:VanZ family protein n=1 Tax=Microbacterium TaxID=33882 RepID=UPI00187D5CB4|nr:VanZ family protein [Microbacterium sp. R1]MBE7955035.1 VanZ family protein [Microbacterium sp. R1]
MNPSARPRASSGPRLLVAGLAALAVVAVTLTPRRFAGPARALLMDFAHVFAAPLVEPMSYLQLESILNALLFVPLGAAVALALSRRLWILAPVLVFGTSFAIEHVQASIPGRVPDVQDIVWNTVGGVVGAVVVGIVRTVLRPIRRSRAGDGE